MRLQDIQNSWDKDSKINPDEIDRAALMISQVHNKYYKIYTNERLIYKKMVEEHSRLRLDKKEYYLGKAPANVYKEKPWNLKILKGEVKEYIDADGDVIDNILKIAYQEEKLSYLESIIKNISQRHWQLKCYIDFLKFKNGII